MTPTIEILIGSPLSGSEAEALTELASSLRPPALILANFEIERPGLSRQVDFLVVTSFRAELLEVKAISAPIIGGLNGPWHIRTAPRLLVPYVGPNPWEQTSGTKFALSDAMHAYARQGTVPAPARKSFFEQFDASVCVYPTIQPGSELPRGNFKAWIKSFPGAITDLNSRFLPLKPSWGLPEWRTFAIEHLKLTPVSLAAAMDASVFSAHLALEAFAIRLESEPIAPLVEAASGEMSGANLLAALSSASAVLLTGRSGLGKSFHLEHYARACLRAGEIPVLLHARFYRGDLNRAIHKSIAPYTILSPADLLDATQRLGRRRVLVVDDWNNCPANLQVDLGKDLSSFQMRYDTRVVVASQICPSEPFFDKFTNIDLSPLRLEQRRQIFAFHGGCGADEPVSKLSEAFSTAYDLRIAGQSCRRGSMPETRWKLYDNYTRRQLPTATARAFVRKLAWSMGENFRAFVPVSEYERIGEQFVEELGAPITLIDEILKARIITVESDTVIFEHDLLKDFFRAECLRHECSDQALILKLAEPKYSGLAEFVVPCIEDGSALPTFLSRTDTNLLSLCFRGSLGERAKAFIQERCIRLLDECRDRLPAVAVTASVHESADGKKSVLEAHTDEGSSVSPFDSRLCSVVVGNLDEPILREKFLELMEIGEWALRRAADQAARVAGVKRLSVWRELIRCSVVIRGNGPIHALIMMCRIFRDQARRFQKTPSPLREALLERVRTKKAGTLVYLLLMAELRYQHVASEDVISLFCQAWATGVYFVQIEALDFLRSCAMAIAQAGVDVETRVIELLDGLDVNDDIMLSTQWVETRSSFSGFDPGVTLEDALAEYRRIISAADTGTDPIYDLTRDGDPTLTFEQFSAASASSSLGKIFEDAFQGVYCEAYKLLTVLERKKLLILALRKDQPGIFTSWYLSQLRSVGCDGAEDVLVRFGSAIDSETCCPQEAVETFVLANDAWASVSEEPIPPRDVSTSDRRGWALIGELVFWLSRPNDTNVQMSLSLLFDSLMDVSEAVPDILHHLERGYLGPRPTPFAGFVKTNRSAVRNVLTKCLNQEGRLTSAFKGGPYRQVELFSWVISMVGELGDEESIDSLRIWAENPIYGKDAIHAIECIDQRRIRSRP